MCVCVCLCLWALLPDLNKSIYLSKRLNVGSRKQCLALAHGLTFSEARDGVEMKFQQGQPNRGAEYRGVRTLRHQDSSAPIQVGGVTIGDFRPVSRCMSETV